MTGFSDPDYSDMLQKRQADSILAFGFQRILVLFCKMMLHD